MARVDITCGTLEAGPEEEAAAALLLSKAELERAARFRFHRDRRRFVVRRARLREVLARACACEPGDLAFVANACGKPRLADGELHFSASHSAERWIVATARHELGVDCEYIDPSIDWRELAQSLFGPREIAALEALPPDQAIRAFFDCWARKEAFVKALGLGLSYPLDAFEVSVTGPPQLVSGCEGWTMTVFDAGREYATALVLADIGAPIEVRLNRELAPVPS